MAEITGRARAIRARTAKVARVFLDKELGDLESEMEDVPGGAKYVRKIRRLVDQGAYLEAGHLIIDPPFWWEDDGPPHAHHERYTICGEWTLLKRLIEYGCAAERAKG